METSVGPVAGIDYPRNSQEFDAWFANEAACRSYVFASVGLRDINALAAGARLRRGLPRGAICIVGSAVVSSRLQREPCLSALANPCGSGFSGKHLDYYLDEYTFRFNRRTSRSRGMLFYRLMQQAVATTSTPYRQLVDGNHKM